MKLFSCSSSVHLADAISKQLSIPISAYELVRFEDTEIKPVVKEDVRGENCIIIASTAPPVNDSYMELFLMVDALKRSAAEKIIVVMPYMGYARQNQQHLPGEPVSAHVMVKFIEAVGIDELITVDLHEEQLSGFFDMPVSHLSALPVLAKVIGEEIKNHEMLKQVQHDGGRIMILSPDQGGVERTRKFRDALATAVNRHPAPESGMTLCVDEETGIVEKLRNLSGQHETKMVEITGDVKDKIVIIPDDVIVSGGTMVNAAKAAKEKGASHVYLAATHADFIDGTVEKLNEAPVDKVFVADTIAIKNEWKSGKLEVVSVASLLTDKIKKLRTI